MSEILNIDITNISFATLFVWLLFDTKKENKNREQKYQETIDKLADKIGVIEIVANDVDDIKKYIYKEGGKNG